MWLISMVRLTFFRFPSTLNDRKSLPIHGAIPRSSATEIVGSKMTNSAPLDRELLPFTLRG
jgi:hypothetical protein